MSEESNGTALEIRIEVHGVGLNCQAPPGMPPDVLRSLLLRVADMIQANMIAAQVTEAMERREKQRNEMRRLGLRN